MEIRRLVLIVLFDLQCTPSVIFSTTCGCMIFKPNFETNRKGAKVKLLPLKQISLSF